MEGLKVILIWLLVIVILVFGGIAIKVLFFPVHIADKSVDLAYGTTNKTMTAENAIYNYEWFKMQEESIESLYKKEDTAKKQLEEYIKLLPEDKGKWTRDDKNEVSRLQSIVSGIENMTNDAIAEYNAKSNMVNRVIFKDNLPSNIDRAFLSGKILTK